jgi:hypothetical protein
VRTPLVRSELASTPLLDPQVARELIDLAARAFARPLTMSAKYWDSASPDQVPLEPPQRLFFAGGSASSTELLCWNARARQQEDS